MTQSQTTADMAADNAFETAPAEGRRTQRDPAQPLGVRELFEAGVHFGHQTKRWNPKMRQYIYGARSGIHIVDLDQTARLFKRAFDFLSDTVSRGGTVLFVGTKRQAQDIVQEEARRAGMFFVTNSATSATVTNFDLRTCAPLGGSKGSAVLPTTAGAFAVPSPPLPWQLLQCSPNTSPPRVTCSVKVAGALAALSPLFASVGEPPHAIANDHVPSISNASRFCMPI